MKRPARVRGWLQALLGLALLLAAGLGAATEPRLLLQDSADGLDPWPYLSVWADPGGQADIATVLRRPETFHAPDVPRNSFGPRPGTLWLRVPVQVPDGDPGGWTLHIDYAELHEADLYLVAGGRVLDRQRLGARVVPAERALLTSGHAARLPLRAGQRHELLLRVRSSGELVVPLRLQREPQLQEQEARLHLQQGLLLGVALALLAYCVLYGLHLRELLFPLYAAQLVTLSGYLSATRGVLGQYLWPHDAWWTLNGAAWLLTLAMAAASAFIDRVLDVPSLSRGCSRVLRGTAVAGVLLALLLWLDWIDQAMLNNVFTVLGGVPVVLGAACAWWRWRQGDRVAGWILAERGVQTLGVGVMIGVVQGVLPATRGTLDAFLWTSAVEMGLWTWALSTRARVMLDAEQRARAEQARLQALAHTDALTGLLNRHGMHEALARAAASARPGHHLAVFVLDLDGFKAVNDRLGHAAGDALLAAVGERLRGCVRSADTVARLGGDEFVVAVADLPHIDAARAIRHALRHQFETPFLLAQGPCTVGATLGLAWAPQDGSDPAALLAAADRAMYAGKPGQGRRSAAAPVAAPER